MWRQWLRWLWQNESGFFGIGQGPSREQKQQYGIMTGVENFGISAGEKATGKSLDFWSAILSGDPMAISKVMGPTFSAINQQGQQQKKTASEFGTRSGGTAALMNAVDDRTLSSIRGLLANLTGTAAGQLGSMGESLIGAGTTAGGYAMSEADRMQQENAAKWNDIFNSIASIAGTAGGFGKAGGLFNKILTGVGGVFQS